MLLWQWRAKDTDVSAAGPLRKPSLATPPAYVPPPDFFEGPNAMEMTPMFVTRAATSTDHHTRPEFRDEEEEEFSPYLRETMGNSELSKQQRDYRLRHGVTRHDLLQH